MLLCIDIGNTNTVIAITEKEEILKKYRIVTKERTNDELELFFTFMLSKQGLSPSQITDVIISSVVPPASENFISFCKAFFKKDPILVNPEMKLGITIAYENPKELGTDRIVNAVAAYTKYKKASIIVDFGTAITFDYVSGDGRYLGGAISPGIITASSALFEKAYRLPKIERFWIPETVLAKNTLDSMNAGIIFGYASLVDGMVKRIKDETKEESLVIATGGLAYLMKDVAKSIDIIDEMLTIYGLIKIYELNS